MTAKNREYLTAVADEMRDIQAKGADADYATVNAWLSVVEAALADNKPQTKTVWNADSIAVNIEHSVGYFPHAYVSVNLTAHDRNNDAVIQQEHMAEEIAALVTEHTTHRENA